MAGLLPRIARSVCYLFDSLRAGDDEALEVFDRVDAQSLDVGEFRASGSMQFNATPVCDFGDTLPAYARGRGPAQSPTARGF